MIFILIAIELILVPLGVFIYFYSYREIPLFVSLFISLIITGFLWQTTNGIIGFISHIKSKKNNINNMDEGEDEPIPDREK